MIRLNYKYSMDQLKVMLKQLIASAQHWNWDAILPALGGLLSILGATKSGGHEKDKVLRMVLIGSEGYDIIRWSVWLLAGLGIVLLIFALKRLFGYGTYSISKYIAILVCLIVGHFIAGLILTEYRSYIMEDLSARLHRQTEQLRLSNSQQRLSYSDHLAGVWDYMQIKMKCCGAEGFRDYGSDSKLLPLSCCVLRSSSVGIAQPENLHQCRHDATLGITTSAFLHTRGCHEPFLTWFMRYTATITGLLFGSVTLQAIALLYLSWQGFMRVHIKDTNS